MQNQAIQHKNVKIEQMNQMLKEKEENNRVIERELMALKQGQRPKGQDGLGDIKEFERLINAIPSMERQVENVVYGRQIDDGINLNGYMEAPSNQQQNQIKSTNVNGPKSNGVQALRPQQRRDYANANLDQQMMDVLQIADRLNQIQDASLVQAQQTALMHQRQRNRRQDRAHLALQAGKKHGASIDEAASPGLDRMSQPGSLHPAGRREELPSKQSSRRARKTGQSFGSATTSTISNKVYKDYNQLNGFDIFFDYFAKLPYSYNAINIVYTLQNVTTQIIEPVQLQRVTSQLDPQDATMNSFVINKSNLLKGVEAHPSCNLVVEIQVPKGQGGYELLMVAYGWTIVNLFDSSRELQGGCIQLPLYQCPMNLQMDLRDIDKLKPIPNAFLYLRITNANSGLDDEVRLVDHANGADLRKYTIPQAHLVEFQNLGYDPFHGLGLGQMNQADELDKEDEEYEQLAEDEIQYQGKGVHLHVEQIANYVPRTTTSVHCTLYQGNKIVKRSDKIDCQFITTPVDVAKVEEDKFDLIDDDPQFGKTLRINQHVLWEQNFHKLLKQNSKQDMNLIFEVYEQWDDSVDLEADNRSEMSKRDYLKAWTPDEIGNSERLFGYAVLKIGNEDHTLKYGTYELGLFKPPIKLKKRFQKDQIPYKTLKITLQLPRDGKVGRARGGDAGYEDEDDGYADDGPLQPGQRKDPRDKGKGALLAPYIECKRRVIEQAKTYQPGQGVDLYIDQLRYLPDCCTCTRLLIRGVNCNQTKTLSTQKAFMNINDSTRMKQVYDFRMEIRLENQLIPSSSLDPSTFIEIVVETIDRSDMVEKIVGYAYFPLFIIKGSAQAGLLAVKTATAPTATVVNFTEGAFQIPIYQERIKPGEVIVMEKIFALPKIRCATILLRCHQCPQEGGQNLNLEEHRPWGDDMLVTKKILRLPQPYHKGSYNNEWCMADRAEQNHYKLKAKRFNPTMNMVIGYLLARRGMRTAKKTQASYILEQLEQLFGKATLNKAQLFKKYENSYEPAYGFRLSLQRLHGLQSSQKKMVHFVVSSMVPPGRLYRQDPSMGPDVHVFQDADWGNCKWNSVQFKEVMNYVGLQGNEKLGILLDVKAYDPTASQMNEIQAVGWAFFPLYKLLENENQSLSLYTNSGLFQLPLFKGSVDKGVLISSLKTEDPFIFLQNEQDLRHLEPTSVIIRIHDNQQQIKAEYGDFSDLDISYLPGGQNVQKYYFNQAENERSKEATLTELFGNKLNSHTDRVLQGMKAAYRVDYGR